MTKILTSKPNQKFYLNFIYKVIDYNSNLSEIERILTTPGLDETQIYKIASAYLLLPSLHNAIVAKKLSSLFSADFLEAIAYIANLNKTRNELLINQIKTIATLFNKHQIDYVFLKGCAVLVSGCCRALSDRMIGDIDILVADNAIEKANELLINDGYVSGDYRIELMFLKHRHLPRLISKKEIGAVELHTEPLRKSVAVLRPKDLLKQKVFENKIAIPCKKHIISNAILSHEVNDYGYLKWDLNFRAVYDYLSLTKDTTYQVPKQRYLRRFFLVKHLYFNTIEFKTTLVERLQIQFLKWRLRQKNFNKFYNYLIVKWYTIPKFPARLFNLIINKRYRNFTFGKLIIFFKKYFNFSNAKA